MLPFLLPQLLYPQPHSLHTLPPPSLQGGASAAAAAASSLLLPGGPGVMLPPPHMQGGAFAGAPWGALLPFPPFMPGLPLGLPPANAPILLQQTAARVRPGSWGQHTRAPHPSGGGGQHGQHTRALHPQAPSGTAIVQHPQQALPPLPFCTFPPMGQPNTGGVGVHPAAAIAWQYLLQQPVMYPPPGLAASLNINTSGFPDLSRALTAAAADRPGHLPALMGPPAVAENAG